VAKRQIPLLRESDDEKVPLSGEALANRGICA